MQGTADITRSLKHEYQWPHKKGLMASIFFVRFKMVSQNIFPSDFNYVIAGYADFSTLEPYRENTLTTMFSSTKGISALCVALLVDR